VLQSTEYRHFRNAVLFSLLLGLLIALFILLYGKEHSFLVINEYNNPSFDYVFTYWTYLGDGAIWVLLFLYVIFFRREYFVAVLAGLIICTLITFTLKHYVFPDSFRPFVVLHGKVHTITGVKINKEHSFPSGHTSTAFTLALLMAFIVRRDIWVYIFPLIAFFVGYSRVYLAQHFVTDVFAGLLTGIVSSWLALLIYDRYRKIKKGVPEAEPPIITETQ